MNQSINHPQGCINRADRLQPLAPSVATIFPPATLPAMAAPSAPPPAMDEPGAAAASLRSAAAAAPPPERIQIVNEEQQFAPDLGAALDRWGLLHAGFGYNLMAVIGSQSTGKSTLLNGLFGTNFDTMNQAVRSQTTKGIWLSRAAKFPVLVMDVEGTDGRERGEDQDFERKSALFSMASVEVLLVNMWEHQVGLYNGANMGLLKTVFEVNLGLFQAAKTSHSSAGQPKDRTHIVFVIRDHIGATPLENLQRTLEADLELIWDSLSKPDGLETSKIKDFFDFSFTTLPHKLLQPAEFDNQVAALRSWFANQSDPRYVFKTEYHKRIPADGLPHYLGSVWEQVQTNKDLDLPTQQELLAQFRCDEIAAAVLAVFTASVKPLRRPIETGEVVPDLGKHVLEFVQLGLRSFDRDAGRYHADVYRRKRSDLLAQMDAALEPLLLGQLKNAHKRTLAAFKKRLVSALRSASDKERGYDFSTLVSGQIQASLKDFRSLAAALRPAALDKSLTSAPAEEGAEAEPWSLAVEEENQLQVEMKAVADQARKSETTKMVANIQKQLIASLAEPTEIALSRPGPDMWDRILLAFKTALEDAETTYHRKAASFDCTPVETSIALHTLRIKSWQALRSKIDEQTTDAALSARLRDLFEEQFRYDEAGTPRVWKPDDDIDLLFRKARDYVLDLIPIYAKVQPENESLIPQFPSLEEDVAVEQADEEDPLDATTSPDADAAHHDALAELDDFDFLSTLVVFTEARTIAISQRFRKEADAYYVEAKRSMVSSISQIPYWVYGVIVVLGWNEFLAIIRNPVYTLFLILATIGAFVVHRLGLEGPLVQVLTTVGKEVHSLADQSLRAHFSQPLPEAAHAAKTTQPASGKIEGTTTGLNGTTPAVAQLHQRTAAAPAPAEEHELDTLPGQPVF